MNYVQRIATNSIYQAAAFGAQGLTEFIVALVLARQAGAEILGEFTTLVILSGVFRFIADFGLPALLTREMARQRENLPFIAQLTNAATGLVIVLSFLALVLMTGVGILSNFSSLMLNALMLTGLALAFESVALVVAAAFRGIEALDRSSAIYAVSHITFLILGLIAIQFNTKLDWIMAIYLASRIIALTVAAWFFNAHFGRLRPIVDLTIWRDLLKKGVPFSVNSVFSFAYSRLDIVILAYLTNYVTVGYYEVVYSLTMRMNIVARALTQALYPFLSSQFVRDQHRMRSYTAMAMRFLVIIGLLMAALLWVFGREFLTVLYGASFAIAAGAALGVLAWAVPIRFVETLLAVVLDATNRAGQRATAVAIAGVTNAILNLVLIPRFQLMGAVYATVLTEIVIIGLFTWYLREEVGGMIAWRSFVSPVLGVLMILPVSLLFGTVNHWALMALCVAGYLVIILAVDRPSLEPLRQLALRRGIDDPSVAPARE